MKIDNQTDFTLLVKTFSGLETVLFQEILKLGGRDLVQIKRGVICKGDLGFVYKLNFCSRLALSVQVKIADLKIYSGDDLYYKAKKLDWNGVLQFNQTFRIDHNIESKFYRDTRYAALRLKDAIADFFIQHHRIRPDVSKDNPDVYIYLHIREQDVSIWLDSSGDSLFKRGYRIKTGEAPLNEVLAAGLVDLSEWQSQFPLVNAMCGSGTIAIEAMLKALDIPPGVMGRKFAFMRWPGFDEELYKQITESRIEKIKEYDLKITAFDNDKNAVKAALENIFNAQAEDSVQVVEADFFDYVPKHKNGILILNPPYDERLKLENAWKYYARIGETLKKNWSTYKAFVITSNLEAVKNLGIKSSHSTDIFAGGLKAVYKRYEVH